MVITINLLWVDRSPVQVMRTIVQSTLNVVRIGKSAVGEKILVEHPDAK